MLRLIAISCALSISACADTRHVGLAPVVPADLLTPVPEPTLRGPTNRHVRDAVIELRSSLGEANGKILAIREIIEGLDDD